MGNMSQGPYELECSRMVLETPYSVLAEHVEL